jgi:hypothetical protein
VPNSRVLCKVLNSKHIDGSDGAWPDDRNQTHRAVSAASELKVVGIVPVN